MKKGPYLKVISFLLILLGIILVIIINFDKIYNFFLGQENLQVLLNIFAVTSGLSGIMVGISGYRATSLETVKEYFLQGDDEKFIKARKSIYDVENAATLQKKIASELKSNNGGENDLAISVSVIINFYHMWGLMVRKWYLPIWVFKGSSGRQLIKIYEKLDCVIAHKRNENVDYAENFTWLYKKVKKKYGY